MLDTILGETCSEQLLDTDEDSSGRCRGCSFGKNQNSTSVTTLIVAMILAYTTNLDAMLRQNVGREKFNGKLLLSNVKTKSSAEDLNGSLDNHSDQSVAEEGHASSCFRDTNCHLSVRRTIAEIVESHIRDETCICDVDIPDETHDK